MNTFGVLIGTYSTRLIVFNSPSMVNFGHPVPSGHTPTITPVIVEKRI
jgi:hypothetical protein